MDDAPPFRAPHGRQHRARAEKRTRHVDAQDLLPFLEQGNLYERSSGLVPFPPPVGPSTVYYPGNNTVYGQSVAVFLCPSDPSVGTDGLVAIDTDPSDRRSRLLRLTDKGRETLATAIPIWRDLHGAIEADMAGFEPDHLRGALKDLSKPAPMRTVAA